jgi:hypothetical protein
MVPWLTRRWSRAAVAGKATGLGEVTGGLVDTFGYWSSPAAARAAGPLLIRVPAAKALSITTMRTGVVKVNMCQADLTMRGIFQFMPTWRALMLLKLADRVHSVDSTSAGLNRACDNRGKSSVPNIWIAVQSHYYSQKHNSCLESSRGVRH